MTQIYCNVPSVSVSEFDEQTSDQRKALNAFECPSCLSWADNDNVVLTSESFRSTDGESYLWKELHQCTCGTKFTCINGV